jgi:ABC-type Fe3+-hydroxamate transport system substrate-binding protein
METTPMTDEALDNLTGEVGDSPHIHHIRAERPIDFVPRRVVSLVPSLTETLFDLDLGDRLAGVTDFCTRPPDGVARLPRVGGTKNPDIARIVALRPDLVLLNREENRADDAEALRLAGIPLWISEPRTVRDAIDLLWLIMDVFEHAAMTYRVRNIEITVEATARYMAAERPVRTFVPIWRDPWMTFNHDTYMHDLLRTCGAENIFAERERRFPLAADLDQAQPDATAAVGRDTRYPRIRLDEVAAAAPELILLPDEPYLFDDADQAELYTVLAATPAAQNGQIHLVDGSFLTWHGTRLAYALHDVPPLVAAARTPEPGHQEG